MRNTLVDVFTLVADMLALVWWLGPPFVVLNMLTFMAWRAYTRRQEHLDD